MPLGFSKEDGVGRARHLRSHLGRLGDLATVMDLASRRVVGWAIADHTEASLACDAICVALTFRRHRPVCSFILTADRNTSRPSSGPCSTSTRSSSRLFPSGQCR
jgi:transposase InsO family protein